MSLSIQQSTDSPASVQFSKLRKNKNGGSCLISTPATTKSRIAKNFQGVARQGVQRRRPQGGSTSRWSPGKEQMHPPSSWRFSQARRIFCSRVLLYAEGAGPLDSIEKGQKAMAIVDFNQICHR